MPLSYLLHKFQLLGRWVFARGICCTKFVHWFFLFKILNIHKTIRREMMCHSRSDQKWSCCLMFDYCMFQITIAQKIQWLHGEKIQKVMNSKRSHKIKHSLFMQNPSNFICIVFSVSPMCYKMSLHCMHGRAGKSLCKNPAVIELQMLDFHLLQHVLHMRKYGITYRSGIYNY